MNKTTYTGIDYGLGRTNIDTKSGIRFGVLPFHDVCQAWCDSSEGNYGEPNECTCNECKEVFFLSTANAANDNPIQWGDTVTCPECGEQMEVELPDCSEPICHEYEADGYKCSQGQDDCDIFILESPYFTYAQFCSPCAPGACYLRSPLDQPNENNKCFCLGHDWFDDGKAPYDVYSVETGMLVNPETR
jgi:hypothetical protein